MNDIELIALHLGRFKSFERKQTFTFPKGPGLFFLTSRNEVSTLLGANGCGKSTLWDALCWLWFDRTPQGLRAGDVASWGVSDGTCVSLDYAVDGKRFTLGRTWKPNKWWLEHDGAVHTLAGDESNMALHHLGTTMDPFLHSVLMSQGQPMFLDLKPEPMSALFGKVLQLDHWVECSTRASKGASLQDSVSRTLEARVARLEGALREIDDNGVSASFDEWERQRNKDLDDLEERHRATADLRAKIKRQLTGVREDLDSAVARQDKARADVDLAHKAVDACLCALRAARADRAAAQAAVKSVEQEMDDLEHAKECDTCRRKWDEASRDDRMRQLGRMLAARTRELNQIDVKPLEAAHDEAVGRLEDAQGQLEAARRGVQEADNRERDLNAQVSSLGKDLDRLEAEAGRLANMRNPAQGAREDLQRRRNEVASELEEVRCDLGTSQGKFMRKQFWVRGFKDIRLQQITHALTQLEVEVNSAVAQLGLQGWQILFKADSETKSGTVKRGFTVEVLSPANSKPVPWASWSGGEAQRLRLAGNLGLSNLIRSRCGITMPLEVWDEPTQFLSHQGVTDLLNALSRRAQDEQRQIWIVDHRSLGYGGFAGTVTVVKGKGGSRFEF